MNTKDGCLASSPRIPTPLVYAYLQAKHYQIWGRKDRGAKQSRRAGQSFFSSLLREAGYGWRWFLHWSGALEYRNHVRAYDFVSETTSDRKTVVWPDLSLREYAPSTLTRQSALAPSWEVDKRMGVGSLGSMLLRPAKAAKSITMA
jgi:hypothetical protein